jgi:hypothetical protein
MTDKAINLDQHRGMAAQKATEIRRALADVKENETVLRLQREELELHLFAAAAENWPEAAEKAVYLLHLFAASFAAEDPRLRKMISAVVEDFERLSTENKGYTNGSES